MRRNLILVQKLVLEWIMLGFKELIITKRDFVKIKSIILLREYQSIRIVLLD